MNFYEKFIAPHREEFMAEAREEVFAEEFKKGYTQGVDETVQECLSNIDKALEAGEMTAEEAASARKFLVEYREERLANIDEIANEAFCRYLERLRQEADKQY